MDGYNQRAAARTSNWRVDAKASEDMQDWFEVEVQDISSGGLMILADRSFNIGDMLTFKLHMHSLMVDYHIEATAEVKNNRGFLDNRHAFGLKFKDISEDDRIRIDVIVTHDDPCLKL